MEGTQRNQPPLPPAKGGLHPKDVRLRLWWIVPGPSLGRSQGPRRMDGACEEWGVRDQFCCQRTASLVWVWPNSKSLMKLYFYRDLLYDIKGIGSWHDFSSRKSLYRNSKKMYRKFYRFAHTKQRLFWPGGLSIRQAQVTTSTKFQMSIDHLMSKKVFRIWHRSKRYARLVSGYMWTIKGPIWLGFLTQPSIFPFRFFLSFFLFFCVCSFTLITHLPCYHHGM